MQTSIPINDILLVFAVISSMATAKLEHGVFFNVH
jgi:hypothetical protein